MGLTLRLKPLFGAIVLGVFVSLATGFIIRVKRVIPEIKHFGYPLFWRVTNLNGSTDYVLSNFAIDTAFWIIIFLFVLIIIDKLCKLDISFNYKKFFFPLVFFIPFGLVMDFIHEFGHAIWGTVVGGRLTYMQIAFFEIYPRLAITPQFQLGLVRVDKLSYGSFEYGLMLLGGSVTTNIVSWLIAIILLKMSLSKKTKVALKSLGLFGILDLPFYVVFPKLGLRHWIFFGGGLPEPLMGAEMVGIPNLFFYLLILISTLGMVFFYFKSILKKLYKTIGKFEGPLQIERLRLVFGALICGVFVSLVTGAIENSPEASIIGATYYGYPLVWRVTMTTLYKANNFILPNLILDTLFWTIIFIIVWIAIQRISKHSTIKT
jgi:hypothetical protein